MTTKTRSSGGINAAWWLWLGVPGLVLWAWCGADVAAKAPTKRRASRSRTPAKKRPPARRTRPRKRRTRRRKAMKLPFSFRGIKLPSNDSRLMHSSTWRRLQAPPKARTKKRKRLPLRRIKTSGQIRLKTEPGWKTSPSFKRRRGRKRIKVQDPGRIKNEVRLVVYKRWLGRHGWNLQWQGHVHIKARAKGQPRWRLQCPRRRFCHRLAIEVRQLLRARPKRLSPRHPQFAWRLRKALERAKGYEIEVQTR